MASSTNVITQVLATTHIYTGYQCDHFTKTPSEMLAIISITTIAHLQPAATPSKTNDHSETASIISKVNCEFFSEPCRCCYFHPGALPICTLDMRERKMCSPITLLPPGLLAQDCHLIEGYACCARRPRAEMSGRRPAEASLDGWYNRESGVSKSLG